MPATIELLLYDVFTARPFAGNPLAVAIDPPALSDEQHQRIARELNLSETVFLRHRADGGWDARIFTPGSELPFAGHPTVGAAIALDERGAAGGGRVVLHEGVGPVVVDLDGELARLTTPGPPRPTDVADPDEVAAVLGITVGDLHPDLGPRGWSAGVPFTICGVRDVETLGRVHVDLARWRETVALTDAPDLYVLTPLEGLDGALWRARMFAPGLGIAEDPATGAAAAAACGFLAGRVGAERVTAGWTIEQGVEMGRPSAIRLAAVVDGAELVAVSVGGRAVRVGSVELLVPPAGG